MTRQDEVLLDQLAERVNQSAASQELADELVQVADAVDAQFLLRRTLNDQQLAGTEREQLARSVFHGRISQPAEDIVAGIAATAWSSGRAMVNALVQTAVRIALLAAREQGRLDQVVAQLGEISQLVAGDARLSVQLADRRRELSARVGLLTELLTSAGASPTAQWFARTAMRDTRRSVVKAIESQLDIAAGIRGHLRGVVTSARALEPGQLDRLHAQLERIYGRQVDLEIAEDPRVLGGIRVEIDNEVIDGTIATKLDEARRLIG